MRVIITPNTPIMTNKVSEKQELVAILEELKEEHIVPINMSTGEFMIKCMTRGLNDFRKDLVVYDC